MARSYSGEADALGKTEDPGSWLDHYESVCLVNGWIYDDEKMSNMSLYLTGEAQTWFRVNKAWILAGDDSWDEVKEHFMSRFRPVNFVEDWEERVQNPVQKIGESVRAYDERYRELVRMMRDEDVPAQRFLTKYWISGLHPSIRRELRIMKPDNFRRAVKFAKDLEATNCAEEYEEFKEKRGRKPQPEVGHSIDVTRNGFLGDEKASLGETQKPNYQDGDPAQDPKFLEFYQTMGSEVTQDIDIEDLTKRFTAWKIYSRVEKDKGQLKALILKAEPGKKGETPTHSEPKVPSSSSPAPKKFLCFKCGKEGHMARSCPEATTSEKTETVAEKKPDEAKDEKKEKKASAKKAEATLDSATAYMVKAFPREKDPEQQKEFENPGNESFAAYMANGKRKKEKEPIVEVPKKAKTAAKTIARRSVDHEVVEMFKKMPVPLELVVRHGASFEAQAKMAIKKVYAEGREYRKKVNPLVNIQTNLDVKLSHAMVVAGTLGKIPCERLVIDPGCSVSMIDVRTARKGPIPIKRESQLTFHLANGEIEKPVGETLERQTINVQGVKVKLRMPVVDSRDSYDVLLGRDWLHAVNAVAKYSKNLYKISKDGVEAKLQGHIYTQKEVELTTSSSESGESSSESENDESEGEEETDDEEEAKDLSEETTEFKPLWLCVSTPRNLMPNPPTEL